MSDENKENDKKEIKVDSIEADKTSNKNTSKESGKWDKLIENVSQSHVYSPELAAFNSAKVLADLIISKKSLDFVSPNQPEKSNDEKKKELILALQSAGVDPLVFDAMLSEEIDRRLKQRFGYAFLFLTFVFTAASYAIVCVNAAWKWGIPDSAIVALIIETPIQFIGLLYIIARNLFPQSEFRSRIELITKNREKNKE